ncbi:MAG: WD40 repeat domain-containing protein [Candidatus Omnitrophota bacterium]
MNQSKSKSLFRIVFMLIYFSFMLSISIFCYAQNSIITLDTNQKFPLVGAMGQSLLGFGGPTDAAFSPDGNEFVISSYNSIVFWRIEKGIPILIYANPNINEKSLFMNVQYSSDGAFLNSVDFYSQIIQWNAKNKQQENVIYNGNPYYNFLAFSANGKKTALYDNLKSKIVFLNHETNMISTSVDKIMRIFNSVDFTSDSKQLIVSTGSNIQYIDTESGEIVKSFSFNDYYSSLSISLDKNYALAANQTKSQFEFIDMNSQDTLLSLSFTQDYKGQMITAIAPNNRFALMGSKGSVMTNMPSTPLTLWDLETGNEVLTFSDSLYIDKIVFSPDSQHFLTLSSTGSAKMWSVEKDTALFEIPGYCSVFEDGVFSPDGKMAATCTGGVFSNDPTVRLWDCKTGLPLAVYRSHTDAVVAVDYSSDGQMIATASKDQTVKIWLVETGEVLQTLAANLGNANDVAFSPDSRFLASAHDDKTVIVWNVNSGDIVFKLSGHQNKVNCLDYSMDGNFIVSGGNDSLAILWNAKNGEKINTIACNSQIMSIALSQDSYYILYGAPGTNAFLLSRETGATLDILNYQSGGVFGVKFSHNNLLIATGSGDSSAHLINLSTKKEIKKLPHMGTCFFVDFSPDDQRLLTREGIWDIKDFQPNKIKDCIQMN